MENYLENSTKAFFVLTLLSVLIACGGGGGDARSPQSAGGGPSSGGGQAQPDLAVGSIVSLDQASAGTCAKLTADALYVSSVEVQGCDDPHEFEIAGKVELEGIAGDPYPGGPMIEADAYKACETLFETYTGTVFWDADYDITTVTPSASLWADGDREAVCLIVALDGGDLVGKAGI